MITQGCHSRAGGTGRVRPPPQKSQPNHKIKENCADAVKTGGVVYKSYMCFRHRAQIGQPLHKNKDNGLDACSGGNEAYRSYVSSRHRAQIGH